MHAARYIRTFGLSNAQSLLRSILYLNAVLAIALLVQSWSLLPEQSIWWVLSMLVLSACALFFLAGQTAVFPLLCRLPWLWRLFPNIDGDYRVEVCSNWSAIKTGLAHPATDDHQGGIAVFNKMGVARIRVRLASVDMRLVRDGCPCSETVMCSPRKDRKTRSTVLFYIFDSVPPDAKTLDQRHLGAAQLRIPPERFPKILEGVYWTDRNWHKGLNTAGNIRLRRMPC
jgi:hypothetical protein